MFESYRADLNLSAGNMDATGGSFLPLVTSYDTSEKSPDRQLRLAALTVVPNSQGQRCVYVIEVEGLSNTNTTSRHVTAIYYTTSVNKDATHEPV